MGIFFCIASSDFLNLYKAKEMKNNMTIIIGKDYGVSMPEGDLLGHMGEHKLRKLRVIHPHFENAVYILKIMYSDSTIYEVEIKDGEISVDGSLLREKGCVKAQFYAFCQHEAADNEASLVFESDIFSLRIGDQLDGDKKAIPTYESSKDMLEKLLTQFKKLSSEPSVSQTQIKRLFAITGKAEKTDGGFITD